MPVGVEGDHMSLSALRGCVREAVTEVPPEWSRGSVELASCCSEVEASSDVVVKDPSDVGTNNKKTKRR